jgi:hypothetical protein
MCTVSFTCKGLESGYLLVTNRDERPSRGLAEPPSVRQAGERKICAPRDSDAGGTWIATDDRGFTVCLLNGSLRQLDGPNVEGAIEAPQSRLRQGYESRGQILLRCIESGDVESAWQLLEERLGSVQWRALAFRLLFVTPPSGQEAASLQRIDWDGESLERAALPSRHLETSSGVEPRAVHRFRRELQDQLFERLQNRDPRPTQKAQLREILQFHRQHRPQQPEGDSYSVCMHRPDAGSVSLTAVAVSEDQVQMLYQPGPPCENRPVAEQSLSRIAAHEL